MMHSADFAECGIRRVGVVGAGVMGTGIAQWLAARGCVVVLRDVRHEALEHAVGVVRRLFSEAVRRGKLFEDDATAGLERLSTTTAWEGFSECDLVIEAVIEDVMLKRRVMAEIAAKVGRSALLASNTSALPLEEFTGDVPGVERVLGLHFFNPVSRMPLVELVVTPCTPPSVVARTREFLHRIGKVPVVCRSSPGFLVTRVLFFYLGAAARLWRSGIAAIEIDAAMREFGWPMGPMRLIDEVGLDVTDFIFREMQHYFPSRFGYAPDCGQLAAAGLLGRKDGAGRGFYRYDEGGERPNEEEARRIVKIETGGDTGRGRGAGDLVGQLMRVMVDEARLCLDEGVVQSAADVDQAMLRGAGFPAARGGLLAWARSEHLL